MNILHLFTITTEQCAYVTIADAMTHLYTEDADRAFDQAVSEEQMWLSVVDMCWGDHTGN